MSIAELEALCAHAEQHGFAEDPVIHLRVPGLRWGRRALVARPNLYGVVVSHIKDNQTTVLVKATDVRRWIAGQHGQITADRMIARQEDF